MDFSRVELSGDDRAFQSVLGELLGTIVTDDVIRRDRATGENFDEGVHLAPGEKGYLAADSNLEADGGFSAVRRRQLAHCPVTPSAANPVLSVVRMVTTVSEIEKTALRRST